MTMPLFACFILGWSGLSGLVSYVLARGSRFKARFAGMLGLLTGLFPPLSLFLMIALFILSPGAGEEI